MVTSTSKTEYGALCRENQIPWRDCDKTAPIFDWINSEESESWYQTQIGPPKFTGRKRTDREDARAMRREIRRRVGQEYGMGPVATAVVLGLISRIVGMLFEYWWNKRNSTSST